MLAWASATAPVAGGVAGAAGRGHHVLQHCPSSSMRWPRVRLFTYSLHAGAHAHDVLSGVFFPREQLPPLVRDLDRLPLTNAVGARCASVHAPVGPSSRCATAWCWQPPRWWPSVGTGMMGCNGGVRRSPCTIMHVQPHPPRPWPRAHAAAFRVVDGVGAALTASASVCTCRQGSLAAWVGLGRL